MKFTLFIPTKNEIDGVRAIMPKIRKEWVDEIIIIDGRSTDGTKEYLEENGYKVITQTLPKTMGAWWEGFQAATGDVIIPFSPDGNSIPEKIPELVEKMKQGYDMVIVSRYKGKAKSDDDDFLSGLANRWITGLINFLFKADYTDTLVMYRAFKKELLDKLDFNWEKSGKQFNIYGAGLYELLFSVRCAKRKLKYAEIPGDEPERIDGTKDSRAHPGKISKAYNGLLMIFYVFKEFFSK
jgi:glycosyltransferase involved in cell wall biosynthesis